MKDTRQRFNVTVDLLHIMHIYFNIINGEVNFRTVIPYLRAPTFISTPASGFTTCLVIGLRLPCPMLDHAKMRAVPD